MKTTQETSNEIHENNVIQLFDKLIEVNRKGYLRHFNDWNEEVALALAEIDQLELLDYHWQIFKLLREYYSEFEAPPPPRIMIRMISDKNNIWGNTNRTLKQTFPLGGYKHACRLAGLPGYQGFAC